MKALGDSSPLHGATTVKTLKDDPAKLMRYDPEELTGFKAFGHLSTSIFTSKVVWKNMSFIMSITLVVAIIIFLCVPNPKTLSLEKLQDIASFFKVLIIIKER